MPCWLIAMPDHDLACAVAQLELWRALAAVLAGFLLGVAGAVTMLSVLLRRRYV
jgi:ABC-type Fe3+-siderophore transport system permease subunit